MPCVADPNWFDTCPVHVPSVFWLSYLDARRDLGFGASLARHVRGRRRGCTIDEHRNQCAVADRLPVVRCNSRTPNRGGLMAAAALADGATSAARAGDGGAGDDSGDNGMNPMYGDSYAVLEGQGHNAGITRIAPEGAFAAHEMDGQKTPLMDQMRQT